MAKFSYAAGTTSLDLNFFIQDSSLTTGAGLTGLTSASAGLTAYYHRQGAAAAVAITLASKTVGTYAVGGFAAVDGTNMPGVYELGVPNTALAAGATWVNIMLKGATNMAPVVAEIELTVFDNQLTTAGLANVSSNVVQWNGTNVSAPATAGIPEVNVKNVNNVAASSVTTVNANIGTTQPVNFTGTGASALAKADTVDVAGAAVSTTAAQIGVNVVNVGGTAQTAGDIIGDTNDIQSRLPAALTANGNMKASLVEILTTALTETAGLLAGGFKKFFNVATPTGTLNSIPDAVAGAASGLAIVGSNMGAVTSVTGAVGSVTGNVGGNVAGSVASVTAAVTVGTNNDKTGYGLSAAAVQAIWDALTSALTTVGSIGKLLVDNLDAAISSRLASASYTEPLDAAGTRSAVGLASANLDTQLSTLAGYVDTEVAAIKAKTDNLPATPAATGDAMTLTSAYDFAKGTVAMTEAYNADGAAPTPAQALMVILQMLTEQNINGTTVTVKKLDGTTTALTLTLDDATTPTAITRAT